MSSGFVSAGLEGPRVPENDDWLKAQRAIEDSRTQKLEQDQQDGGRSLYEVLQQNKTAKQEAFEEAIRLKNQFRTLDDDEVDFLDSVLESTRAKELQVQRETAEQLGAYRKQRDAAEKALIEGNAIAETSNAETKMPAAGESWATSGRKRRRVYGKDGDGTGKLRKKSSVPDPPQSKPSQDLKTPHSATLASGTSRTSSSDNSGACIGAANASPTGVKEPTVPVLSPRLSPPALGLGAYGSDED